MLDVDELAIVCGREEDVALFVRADPVGVERCLADAAIGKVGDDVVSERIAFTGRRAIDGRSLKGGAGVRVHLLTEERRQLAKIAPGSTATPKALIRSRLQIDGEGIEIVGFAALTNGASAHPRLIAREAVRLKPSVEQREHLIRDDHLHRVDEYNSSARGLRFNHDRKISLLRF